MMLWAVFHGDGCECSNFVGIFSSPELAREYASNLAAKVKAEFAELNKDDEWMLAGGPMDIISFCKVQVDSEFESYGAEQEIIMREELPE